MGVITIIVLLFILGIIFFGFIIPSGLLTGAGVNTNFFKQSQTDIIEKQEAEKNKIKSNSGEKICNLKLKVSGYFEIATKDLLSVPTKVTGYLDGKGISYNWSGCRVVNKQVSPDALSLLSLFSNLNYDVYGKPKPVTMDLVDISQLQENSFLPVSGSTDLEIKLVASDGKFVDSRTYPSLSKTMTVNGQTPIQFSKEYFLDGLPNRDYSVEISFSDMSINEDAIGKPYVYNLKKCSTCK